MQTKTQEQQVIAAMRRNGGYATLRHLNEIVDVSAWRTKTPEATIRRIVQQSGHIFRIQPGLWALEDMRSEVLNKFDLKLGNKNSEEKFTHGYYQGLLTEIGKFRGMETYIPAQDQNRLCMGQALKTLANTIVLPEFTYPKLLQKARTVDVIWFNQERHMPTAFYEVEHTTDIRNSLSKFYELQDFYAHFYIVASESRRKEFEDKLHGSMFSTIEERVCFRTYDKVVQEYNGLKQVNDALL